MDSAANPGFPAGKCFGPALEQKLFLLLLSGMLPGFRKAAGCLKSIQRILPIFGKSGHDLLLAVGGQILKEILPQRVWADGSSV